MNTNTLPSQSVQGETNLKFSRYYRVRIPDPLWSTKRRILESELASKDGDAAKAAYAREWRRKNPQKYAATRKKWAINNREKLRKKTNDYYAKHREKRLAQNKASNMRHASKIKATRKLDRANRKEFINARWRDYYARNPEKLSEKYKKYLPRRMELRKLRRASDPIERIKDACRTRVRFILEKAGVAKHDHTFDLVGCTPDFLKSFLEAQFNPMMNWNNYGTYWEIDHIIAVSKFNLEDREQLNKAFHYSNCRPLEVPSNRAKCDNGIGFHQPLLI